MLKRRDDFCDRCRRDDLVVGAGTDLTDLFTRPNLRLPVPSTKAGAVREWFAHRWFDYQALPPDVGPRTPNGCGPNNLAPPR